MIGTGKIVAGSKKQKIVLSSGVKDREKGTGFFACISLVLRMQSMIFTSWYHLLAMLVILLTWYYQSMSFSISDLRMQQSGRFTRVYTIGLKPFVLCGLKHFHCEMRTWLLSLCTHLQGSREYTLYLG